MSNRTKALNILTELSLQGITEREILEHILYNVLSGDKAVEVLEDCLEEFNVEFEE